MVETYNVNALVSAALSVADNCGCIMVGPWAKERKETGAKPTKKKGGPAQRKAQSARARRDRDDDCQPLSDIPVGALGTLATEISIY